MGATLRHLCAHLAHRWLPRWLALASGGVAVLLLVLVGVLLTADFKPAILDSTSGGIVGWGVLLAFALFAFTLLIGTIPNFLHAWIASHYNSRLRSSRTFFSNHDLTKAVGDCLRLILLDAADPQPGDQLPRVRSADACTWLRNHAAAAPALWETLVTVEAHKPNSEYKALFEANLWEFVERRDAPALPEWAWKKVLEHLNGGKRLDFDNDAEAMRVIVHRLNARFGEALWEYTKNDFVNGGAQTEAMDLLIASQLLKRTTAMAEGIEKLNEALADLAGEWIKHRAAVTAKVNTLTRHQAWSIRLLSANTDTLRVIESKLEEMHKGSQKQFAAVVKELAEIKRGVNSRVPPPPTDNLTLEGVPNNEAKFKGRAADLAALNRRVRNDPPGLPIPIIAAPGLGKTAFVTRYAYLYQADFDHVWWVRAAGKASPGVTTALERSLAALLDIWGIDSKSIPGDEPTTRLDALAQRVCGWLARPKADGTATKHLVILDNVDEYATLQRIIVKSPSRVIFTARAASLARDGAVALPFVALTPEDGVLVLGAKVTQWNPAAHQPTLKRLGTLVGWNALALTYLAAVLARHKTGLTDPAEELLDPLESALGSSLRCGDTSLIKDKHEQERPTDYGPSLEEAFAQFVAPFASRPEMAVLEASSLCEADRIPRTLLRDASGLDVQQFDDAAAELVRAGVLERDGDNVNLHRMTQASVRADLGARGGNSRTSALERLLKAFIKLYEEPDKHETDDQRSAALPHAESVLLYVGLSAIPDNLPAQAAVLRAIIAHHLWDIGQLASALEHINCALALSKEFPVENATQNRSVWLGYRATILQSLGDLDEAKRDIEGAIELSFASGKQLPKQVYGWKGRLARILQDMDDPNGALKILKECIEWGDRQPDKNSRSLAVWHGFSGDCLQDLGQYTDAKMEIEKCVHWFGTQVPLDKISFHTFNRRYASILLDCGSIDKSAKIIHNAIEFFTAQPKRDEREIALCFTVQSRISASLGNWSEAKDSIDKAIQSFFVVYGEKGMLTKKACVWQTFIAAKQVPPRWNKTVPEAPPSSSGQP